MRAYPRPDSGSPRRKSPSPTHADPQRHGGFTPVRMPFCRGVPDNRDMKRQRRHVCPRTQTIRTPSTSVCAAGYGAGTTRMAGSSTSVHGRGAPGTTHGGYDPFVRGCPAKAALRPKVHCGQRSRRGDGRCRCIGGHRHLRNGAAPVSRASRYQITLAVQRTRRVMAPCWRNGMVWSWHPSRTAQTPR